MQPHDTTSRPQSNLSERPEYNSWRAMKGRCRYINRRNLRYSGRGIVVCERWRESFANFLADIGPSPSPDHTVDRIDNSGNYSCGHCPECRRNGWAANCKWATRVEQAFNQDKTHRIVFNDEAMTIRHLAEMTQLPYTTLFYRIVKRGMSPEQAVKYKRHTKPNIVRSAIKRASDQSGIPYNTLYNRMRNNGMTLDQAVAKGRYEGRKLP